MAAPGINSFVQKADFGASSGGASSSEVKIRKEFPESWIYENFNDFGFVEKMTYLNLVFFRVCSFMCWHFSQTCTFLCFDSFEIYIIFTLFTLNRT